jgi:arylsulfatase A-like enzyme
VANGDSPLLIPVGTTTLPAILKTAGYRTAAVGKWHLGFGIAAPDYNQAVEARSARDRLRRVFWFSGYERSHAARLCARASRRRDSIPTTPSAIPTTQPTPRLVNWANTAAGQQRIGWMSGGKAAFWKDEDIADTFTQEAVAFVERNKADPFFLYFAPHDVHPPTISHRRFVGTSGLGPRADMMQELDWSVGEILNTLDRLGLATNTLVIFSSDNGASPTDEQGHRPNGPWRGKKSQLWEGGHREPFLARWPGRIGPLEFPAR